MAILKVFVDPSKSQNAEATYDPNSNLTRLTVNETWIVQTDDKTYRPSDMFNASDGTNTIPLTGNSYNVGHAALSLTCDKVSPKLSTESPTVFEVEVGYYFEQLPAATKKLAITSVAYPQSCYYDKDNNPIVNKAGQTFDPTLTKTYYDLKLTLSYQSYTTPPIALILAAQGKVCSDSVLITAGGYSTTFTARQLKLDEPSMEFEYAGAYVLWRSSISFIARVDTWVDKLLNQGYAQLDSSNNLVAIADANGDPLNSPALLDNSGKLLSFGATPIFLTFKVEQEAPMSSIVSAII